MSSPTPIRRVTFDASDAVADPDRLAALERAILCDTDPEPAFDRLTDLIVDLIDVPVALVSLVDRDRQFFKAQTGLPEPWATERQTPLSHSFCQYLVAADAPLVITDGRDDPVLASNRAIAELGVVAYAGFPIAGSGGRPIGSLCAIDSSPRDWDDAELSVLRRLAEVVSDLVQIRTAAMVADERRRSLARMVESQEQERSRIAAELHDDSLQSLSALSIRLQLLAREAGDHAAAIEAVAEDVKGTAHRIRRFVSGLRPDAIEHDTLANVLHAHLIDRAADHPEIDLRIAGGVRTEPDAPVRIALFRIAQQAVDNAIAHAHPSTIAVELDSALGATRMSIRDDGIGFDPDEDAGDRSFGLRIMRERAEMLDGTFEIHSTIGSGSTVTATIPD